MPKMRSTLGAGLLSVALVTQAMAQDAADTKAQPAPDAATPALSQVIYKGLLGNALETVPMDPEKRVTLQRANAVVSGTTAGKTLAGLARLSNPILLIGGFLWGAWSAANISSKPADLKTPAQTHSTAGRMNAQEVSVVRSGAGYVATDPNFAMSWREASVQDNAGQRVADNIAAAAAVTP